MPSGSVLPAAISLGKTPRARTDRTARPSDESAATTHDGIIALPQLVSRVYELAVGTRSPTPFALYQVALTGTGAAEHVGLQHDPADPGDIKRCGKPEVNSGKCSATARGERGAHPGVQQGIYVASHPARSRALSQRSALGEERRHLAALE